MPVHAVVQRQRVGLGRRAGGEGAQQRLGEGEQSGDRGEGVAGQADEVLVLLEARQQHGVAGAHLDAVHQEVGADALQDGVHMVDGARGGAAGGDDQVGVGGRDGAVQGPGVVPDPADRADVGAQGAQPGRQHRAERVPDEAVVRQSPGEQLVAEDQDVDAGPGDRGEGVVPGGRREAQHGGRHHGADGQQVVAAAALLGARADVLPVDHLAGRVQTSSFVGAAVLAAQHRGGLRGDTGAGGDADGFSVGQGSGLGVARQRALVTHRPGGGTGDRPAVHRGGVEGRQVGQGGERGGQGEAEGRVEGRVDGVAAGGPDGGAARPLGDRAGLWPRGRAVAGVAGAVEGAGVTGTLAARVARGRGLRGRGRPVVGAARGAAVLLHEGERLLDVEVFGFLAGPGAGGGHQASGRVSGVASGATSGSPAGVSAAAASCAQRWARAAALRAVSATASVPPPARPAA